MTGPRQSGKTTLCLDLFSGYAYVNLEKPDVRNFAIEDPNGFLAQLKTPVILDEIQRVPQLFSYLMPIVDSEKTPGRFILAGSQNFLLMEAVSQSLAGRCAIFHLLPFSWRELAGYSPLAIFAFGKQNAVKKPKGFELNQIMQRGFYPPVHDRGYAPFDWLGQYTQTYLERDVRNLVNIGELETFERFLRLCAGRSGQILNYSSLAADCGVSMVTAKRWLSVLKASFIVTTLQPYYQNFNKRMIKSPKLYFIDTGLLCYLLGIRNHEELVSHSARGAIFETFVVSELIKEYFSVGTEPPLYYWRDSAGHEIDIVIVNGERLYPIEIKSGATVASDMFNGLKWWQNLTDSESGALVYGGDDCYTRQGVKVLPWFNI
ncbi:MAG: ATP-binding protein [Victivallaceae bacterium]